MYAHIIGTYEARSTSAGRYYVREKVRSIQLTRSHHRRSDTCVATRAYNSILYVLRARINV